MTGPEPRQARLAALLRRAPVVPVLTIDGQSKADSTPIGLWLDELFPDHPRLLPIDDNERERLLAIDHWVSHRLIPGQRSRPSSPNQS